MRLSKSLLLDPLARPHFSSRLLVSPLTKPRFSKYLLASPVSRLFDKRTIHTPTYHFPKIPAIAFPLTKKRSLGEWMFWFALFGYIMMCVGVYFYYVAPWITGETNIRIGADSDRYWEFARYFGDVPVLSVTQNRLGPITLAMILKSGFLVMCFNVVLLLIALKIADTIPNVNRTVFGLLLLANAELLPSLTTLNKEIFALLASVMTVKYVYSSRPKLLLLLTLFVAVCARWEQPAMLVFYLVTARLKIPPKWLLILLILAITIGYPFAFRILGVDPSSFDWLMADANTIVKLNSIQNAFGFPLVLPLKALMLMGGSWISPHFYTNNLAFAGNLEDYQQIIFQPLGCLAFLIVFYVAFRTGRLRLDNPVTVLSLITIILTAASPFIQPRYLYGVYTMLCLELARPKNPRLPSLRLQKREHFLRGT